MNRLINKFFISQIEIGEYVLEDYIVYILLGVAAILIVLILILGLKFEKKKEKKKIEKRLKDRGIIKEDIKKEETDDKQEESLVKQEKTPLVKEEIKKEEKTLKQDEDGVKPLGIISNKPIVSNKEEVITSKEVVIPVISNKEEPKPTPDTKVNSTNMTKEEVIKQINKDQVSAVQVNSPLLKPITLPKPGMNDTMIFGLQTEENKQNNYNIDVKEENKELFETSNLTKVVIPEVSPVVEKDSLEDTRYDLNKPKYDKKPLASDSNRSRYKENQELYNKQENVTEVISKPIVEEKEEHTKEQLEYTKSELSKINTSIDSIAKAIEEDIKNDNVKLTTYEQEQEDNAIISYQDLIKSQDTKKQDDYVEKMEELDNIDEDTKVLSDDMEFLEELKKLRDNI